MKIWPAIDLLEGKCVRLVEGSYSQSTVYSTDPVEMAKKFADEGTKRIHVVDLSRARNPQNSQIKVIEKIISHTSLSLQVGGGIRTQNDAQELKSIGVKRIILGSIAVKNYEETQKIIELNMEIVLALDVREQEGGYKVATDAWAKTSTLTPQEMWEKYPHVKSLLCTDISRDGRLEGPNFSLYRELRLQIQQKNQQRNQLSGIELLASGGVKSIDDLYKLNELGCDGVVLGKSLYENKFNLREALACYPEE